MLRDASDFEIFVTPITAPDDLPSGPAVVWPDRIRTEAQATGVARSGH
jgi:hypothetical protein